MRVHRRASEDISGHSAVVLISGLGQTGAKGTSHTISALYLISDVLLMHYEMMKKILTSECV